MPESYVDARVNNGSIKTYLRFVEDLEVLKYITVSSPLQCTSVQGNKLLSVVDFPARLSKLFSSQR